MLVFTDETGINPLPPGVLVTVYPAGAQQVSGNVLISGYTQLGGILNGDVAGAVQYVATFYGTLAPELPQVFYGNANPGQNTIISVDQYRSPFLSQQGYTEEALRLYINGWLGDSAQAAGDPANALFSAFASALGAIDLEQQQILAAERVQTSTGSALDSWAFDFFGPYLLRYIDEPDDVYLSRIYAAFGPRGTINAIQQAVTQFYVATANQALQKLIAENLALDTKLGALDNLGALNNIITQAGIALPVVTVWDGRTQPGLAAQYNIYPPKFVIGIGFSGGLSAWYLDHSALDIDTVLIDGNFVQTSTTPPDARLGFLVNFFKCTGRQPYYQTYIV